MPQVPSSTTVHDVVVVGSGAGGGTVTNVLANMGVSVLLLEAGPMLSLSDLKEHMWPYNVPHRGAGRKRTGLHQRADRLHLQRDLRRFAARGRAVHRGAGQRLLVVSFADPRRPHEPLRSRHAADGRLRLQATSHRRPRLRLADQLQRSRAVLRQGGATSSASPARSKASAARPTASSIHRRRCGRTTCSCSARARKTASAPWPRDRRSRRCRETAGRRATTVASADAAARRHRTTPRATSRFFRR